MNTRSKTGILILQVALGIGVLADVLLRQTPWGLNVFLFNLAFVAGAVVLLKRQRPEYLTAQTWALLAAQVFFAAMFVWRDSEQLLVADSVSIVAIMSVLIVPKLGLAPRVADALHYIAGFVWAVLNSIFGGIALLVGDIEWKTADRSAVSRTAIGIIRGLLIATPFILIFGALFVAADAAYEGLVNRVFNFDISIAISHIALFSVFAWATAGYLRAMTLGNAPLSGVTGGNTNVRERTSSSAEGVVDALSTDSVENSSLPDNATVLEHINRSDPPQAETRPSGSVSETSAASANSNQSRPKWSWATLDNGFLPSAFTLGAVEIGIIFGLIDLLFVSFVVIQIPYLFGGMELVQNTPDFKLAEYARRGFGELVAVAALVLPLLLVTHWLIRSETARAERLFRVLAGVQIALLFVIMASAVQRLVVLTGPLGYGLTTLRFYPMVFMTWLTVVFLWFAFTVLRGNRKFFAWGALWSAFFILAATHVLNPDDFIVRTNIKLMQQGREFDAGYNASLSQDAVPAILTSFSGLSDRDQCIVRMTLSGRFSSRREQDNTDPRSWNLARHKAASLLIENTKALHYDEAMSPKGECFDQ